MSRIDESREFLPVRIAILTVSDTRGPGDDRSGDTLVERVQAAGHVLAARSILPDDRGRIADQLRVWIADPTTFGMIDDTVVQVEYIQSAATGQSLRDKYAGADSLWYSVVTDAGGRFVLPGLL